MQTENKEPPVSAECESSDCVPMKESAVKNKSHCRVEIKQV